jgi:hypothetical protein
MKMRVLQAFIGVVLTLSVIFTSCDLIGDYVDTGNESGEQVADDGGSDVDDDDSGLPGDDGQDDSTDENGETSDEEPEDTTPPESPVVSGQDLTNDNTPEWSWTTPVDANEFRLQLDGEEGEWTVNPLETTSFSAPSALADGEYTLYVQAADASGNWSESGSFTVVVDTLPPEQGELTVSVSDDIRRPTWSWEPIPDAVEVGYRLDTTDGEWSITTDLEFTPPDPLSASEHVLYLSAVDTAGNRSDPVSATAPYIEYVTVLQPDIENGSITLNPPAGSMEYGTVLTVTAGADTGFVFDGWDAPYHGFEKNFTIELVAEEYAFNGSFAVIDTKMVPELSSGMTISSSITYYFYMTLTNTSTESVVINSVEAYDPDGILQASSSDQALLGELQPGESNSLSVANSTNVFGAGSTVKWYCTLDGYEFVVTKALSLQK